MINKIRLLFTSELDGALYTRLAKQSAEEPSESTIIGVIYGLEGFTSSPILVKEVTDAIRRENVRRGQLNATVQISTCGECKEFGSRRNKSLGFDEGYCGHPHFLAGDGATGEPYNIGYSSIPPNWCPLSKKG